MSCLIWTAQFAQRNLNEGLFAGSNEAFKYEYVLIWKFAYLKSPFD